MRKNLTKFLLLVTAFTFALSINYIFAAWTGPIQAPPGGNAPTPVHIGTTNQVKDGGLGLNALSVFGNGYFQDNVGIGTVSPQAKLDVAGDAKISQGLQVGNTSNAIAGTIRWTGSDFEGYDGSAWKSFTVSGGGGACPPGKDLVVIGGATTCLADGAEAGSGCRIGYQRTGVGGGNVDFYFYARYTSGKVQSRVVGAYGRDSGWVDGLTASYDGGSAQTSVSGVMGSGSIEVGDGTGSYAWWESCTSPVGVWK